MQMITNVTRVPIYDCLLSLLYRTYSRAKANSHVTTGWEQISNLDDISTYQITIEYDGKNLSEFIQVRNKIKSGLEMCRRGRGQKT